MTSKKYKFNSLVLHRVVDTDKEIKNFEDITIEKLNYILDKDFLFPTIDHVFSGAALKKNAVCLTFDDGNMSDYKKVMPALISRGCHATFFIISSLIDKPNYITRNELFEMYSAGMQIGSHSHTHPNFKNITKNQIKEELYVSKNILEEIINDEITSFSYPYGLESSNSIEQVFKAGYKNCLTSRHGISNTKNHVIYRNSINKNTSYSSIDAAIDPSLNKRFSWYIEDKVKSILKYIMPNSYQQYRDLWFNFFK